MSNHLVRFLLSGLLCLAFAGLTACGGEDDPDEGTTYDCVEDSDCESGESCTSTGFCIVDQTCSGDVDCADGEVCLADGCVEGCRFASDCEGTDICVENSCEARKCDVDADCGAGSRCDRGVCEEAPLECEGAEVGGNVACNPEAESVEGTICVDFGAGNKCYFTCDMPTSDENVCIDDRFEPCDAGSFCATVGQAPNTLDVCYVSECQHPGDSAGCQNLIDADPDRFPNGANCVPYDNDQRVFGCVAAGVLEEDDECGADIDDDCGEGLICGFDSTCKPVCSGDDDCNGDDRCIGDDTGRFLAGTNYGICGEGCDPFSRGQCSGGNGCLPVTPQDGLCLETGTVPAYEACEGYVTCESASDCPNNEACEDEVCQIDRPSQCEEGTQCVTLNPRDIGEYGDGRCLPVCDTTSDSQAVMDSTCPGGDESSFVRFYHLAPGSGDLDVFLDDQLIIDNRSSDTSAMGVQAGGYFEMPLGFGTIRVVDASDGHNGNPLAQLTVNRALNQQTTFAIVRQSDDLEDLDIIELDVPRAVSPPAAGDSSARVSLDADLGQAVDVYLVADGDDVADASPVATAITYGEASDFSAGLTPGDYDMHVFDAGADPDQDSPSFSMEVALVANNQVTMHIWGTPNSNGEFTSLSAVSVKYNEAPMTRVQGYCLDQGNTTGLCFERCSGAEGYGQGECSDDGDTCFAFSEAQHVCWPSEKIAEGDACPIDQQNPCVEGSYCLENGNGDGVCTSYCVPGGSDNPALSCDDGAATACEPIGAPSFNFGRCGIPCEPRDFPYDVSSPDCPTGLETCVSYATDENNEPAQAFCRPSGPINVGSGCGDVGVETCAPGGICRKSTAYPECSRAPRRGTLQDTLYGPSGIVGGTDGGVCREVCELFADSCTDPDEACMIDGSTMSTKVGFCMPKADELDGLESLDPCPYELNGMMCGDGSVCTTLSGSSLCMQWCDQKTDAGCAEGLECSRLFDADTIELGYCTEPR